MEADPVGPVAAVVAAGGLDEAGLDPDPAIQDVLHAEVSAVVLVPAELLEVVALLAPVPQPQAALAHVSADTEGEARIKTHGQQRLTSAETT